MTMAEILTTLGSVAGTVFELAGTALDFVIANPICLIGPGMYLVHRGIGAVKSLVVGM